MSTSISPYKRIIFAIVVLLVLLAALSFAALASTDAVFSLSWWTVDGGGGTASNGSYSLEGTIGQPDAGATITGAGYELNGGFWAMAPSGRQLYLPLVIR